MDLFQLLLFISLVTGILLIIISMILYSRENRSQSEDFKERGNAIRAIDASIKDLDKMTDEFESLCKAALGELDDKYQEILFLYSLLDEKKQEIAGLNTEKAKPVPSSNEGFGAAQSPERTVLPGGAHTDAGESLKPQRRYEHPKAKDILELKNSGLGIAEIAKQLNIGKGEVKLIIELSK